MKLNGLLLLTCVCLCLVPSKPGAGQSIVAVTRLTPTSTEYVFTSIDIHTGKTTVISPASPSLYAGLGSVGQSVFATLGVSLSTNLYQVDIRSNTPTLVGTMPNATYSALDIMANGTAYTISRNSNNPQLYSVDLSTAATTAIGTPDSLRDPFVALGGRAPSLLGLGSVGAKLYAVENFSSQRSLLEIDPITGDARIVGGQLGLLASGTLSNGLARSRYSAFGAGLAGVDTDGDGDFDQLFGAVNSFDDDNDSTTPTVSIGGLGLFDLNTGLWELVGTNPGQSHSAMAFLPVPEPTAVGPLSLALALIAERRRRARRG